MTPLRFNLDFTLGTHSSFLAKGWPHPSVRAMQFFDDSRRLPQNALASKMNIDSFPFWTYVQLRNFFNSSRPRPDWSRRTTKFEDLYLCEEPLRHLISSTYSLMFSTHSPKIN